MTFLETRSGHHFDYADPQPDDVELDDIIHVLSVTPRFNGHSIRPYYTAQHCVLVYNLVKEWTSDIEILKAALMHDAHEAYVTDIPSPLKWAIGDSWTAFDDVEREIDKAIGEKVGFDPKLIKHDLVQRGDRHALWYEARDVMFSGGAGWSWSKVMGDHPFPSGDLDEIIIVPSSFAHSEFKNTCRVLGIL